LNCLPIVTCPACQKETQFDDYYEMRAGDERECRHCEATIVVTSVVTCTYVTVKVASTVSAKHE
jgi:hypothetical protein